jgi:hypothetical protein
MSWMSLSFRTFAIQVFILLPMIAYATPQNTLPAQLMYLGKAIDPLCLFDLESAKSVVDLSHCGLNLKTQYKILGKNNTLMSKGFIGYDYGLKTNDSTHLSGYSYYKSLGTVGRFAIVQTINNSGGTGVFSFLNLIQRDGDSINVSVIKGGDRCNGGVVNSTRKGTSTNERLVYSVNLTPYDFLTLTHDNPHHLKAYKDLSACAACCAAHAVYQRSVGVNFSNEKLLYIDVSHYLQNITPTKTTQKSMALP